jgi:hypothetical protein
MSQLPFPQYISAKQWAAELLRVYRDERLPILYDEDKWKEWANYVAGTGIFRANGIPSATGIKNSKKIDSFKGWQEWAKAVYIIMIKIKTKR